MGINDNLMLMRMSIPVAYTVAGFSVGLAPVIEYGALSMGTGVTTDIAMGFEIGAAYSIAGVSMGLDYKSAVTHDFKNTFNSTIDSTNGQLDPTNVQSKLDTPAVLGLGVSYEIAGSTIALDYKNIAYSSAKGFEDFGWENQSVFALGYEYAADVWALRAGYNYGASPLSTDMNVNGSNMNPIVGSLMMFPAVCESHYTVGGSYNFNETISADLAFMYATGSATTDIPGFDPATGLPVGAYVGEVTATNDQTALSFALNYAY